MNIPLMGTAAGISTTNNRWAYCLAFVCAYITFGILPEMIAEKDLKTEKLICILPIIFGVYLIFRNAGQKDAVLSAVCIFIAAVSWGLIPALKSIDHKYFILFSTLFITLFLNMLEAGDIRHLINIGNTNAYLDSFINSQAREISDSGFFRIDHSNNAEYTTEWNCNLPYWYGYNGVSGFRSILNENFVQYLQQNGFIGLLHRSKIAGFDGRTTDEILSCVKYYLKDPVNPVIPYGFHPTENDVIRQSDLLLPFEYTYSSAVSSEYYRSLNAAERQEIMLRAVVLEQELPRFADNIVFSFLRSAEAQVPSAFRPINCSVPRPLSVLCRRILNT